MHSSIEAHKWVDKTAATNTAHVHCIFLDTRESKVSNIRIESVPVKSVPCRDIRAHNSTHKHHAWSEETYTPQTLIKCPYFWTAKTHLWFILSSYFMISGTCAQRSARPQTQQKPTLCLTGSSWCTPKEINITVELYIDSKSNHPVACAHSGWLANHWRANVVCHLSVVVTNLLRLKTTLCVALRSWHSRPIACCSDGTSVLLNSDESL